MGFLDREGEADRAGDLDFVRRGEAPRSPGRGDLWGITAVERSSSPRYIDRITLIYLINGEESHR